MTKAFACDEPGTATAGDDCLGIHIPNPFIVDAVNDQDFARNRFKEVCGRKAVDGTAPHARHAPFETELSFLAKVEARAEFARYIEEAIGAGEKRNLLHRHRGRQWRAALRDPKRDKAAEAMPDDTPKGLERSGDAMRCPRAGREVGEFAFGAAVSRQVEKHHPIAGAAKRFGKGRHERRLGRPAMNEKDRALRRARGRDDIGPHPSDMAMTGLTKVKPGPLGKPVIIAGALLGGIAEQPECLLGPNRRRVTISYRHYHHKSHSP